MHTTNYEKHTTSNPISRFFLDNFLKEVVKTLKTLNIHSLLDVGCGEGFTLYTLKQQRIGETLEGVDALDAAIRIGHKLHPNLTLKKGDVYNLKYKSNSFDLVLCTEVLEHLKDPEIGLKELIRVSKKYILVTVPNEPFFTIQRFFRGKNVLHFGSHPEHIKHWTSRSFETFVLNQSVKVKKKRLPFPWTMLLLEKREV